MADGFLGRWSQRKQAVREGKALAEPPAPTPATPAPVLLPEAAPPVGAAGAVEAQPSTPPTAAPPPSLDDVQRLTPQSDFAPFVARGVAPEVRNAAMKKLFADPHYNVMDRLDIYIDDYSRPDPLPASMLRQMASAKFLKLFEEEEQEKDPSEGGLRNGAPGSNPHSVAPSAQPPASGTDPLIEHQPEPPGIDHDHTDLRLQPNHAAGPQEPGRRTE